MKNKYLGFHSLSFLLLGGMLILQGTAHAGPLKTLSGRVNHTDLNKETLVVDFTHPATGMVQAMQFRVTQETGLNGFHALADMRPQDIVTVDYEEQKEGLLKAVYVAKFRIAGPPTGLENFKGL